MFESADHRKRRLARAAVQAYSRASVPPQGPHCYVNSLPPELLLLTFRHALAVGAPRYDRKSGKVYGSMDLEEHEIGALMLHPWDGSNAYFDLLHHPKCDSGSLWGRGPTRVWEDMWAWRATCRAWREVTEPFSSSWMAVDLADVSTPIPSGTRHLDLTSSGPVDDVPRLLQLSLATALVSLSIDPDSAVEFGGILGRLPGSFGQLEALHLSNWEQLDDWGVSEGGEIPDSFFAALSRCYALKRLLFACEGGSSSRLLEAIRPLQHLQSLTLGMCDTSAPDDLASILRGKPLRYLEIRNLDLHLQDVLSAVGECASTLQVLHAEQSREASFVAGDLPTVYPLFPKLEYLAVNGAVVDDDDEDVCWTAIPALVSLIDNSPRVTHLTMSYLNWEEPKPKKALPKSRRPLSPTDRFLRKLEDGVVRKAWLMGNLPARIQEYETKPLKRWQKSPLEMLYIW